MLEKLNKDHYTATSKDEVVILAELGFKPYGKDTRKDGTVSFYYYEIPDNSIKAIRAELKARLSR